MLKSYFPANRCPAIQNGTQLLNDKRLNTCLKIKHKKFIEYYKSNWNDIKQQETNALPLFWSSIMLNISPMLIPKSC